MHSIHIARLRVPLLDVIHVATNAHGVLRVSLCDDGDTLAKELRARYPNAVLKRGGGLSVDDKSFAGLFLQIAQPIQ